MIFKNSKVYDVLKALALVWIDAIGLFYMTIAEIWDLPYGAEIQATCVAVSVLIGAFIGVSRSAYKKQIALEVDNDDDC